MSPQEKAKRLELTEATLEEPTPEPIASKDMLDQIFGKKGGNETT